MGRAIDWHSTRRRIEIEPPKGSKEVRERYADRINYMLRDNNRRAGNVQASLEESVLVVMDASITRSLLNAIFLSRWSHWECIRVLR